MDAPSVDVSWSCLMGIGNKYCARLQVQPSRNKLPDVMFFSNGRRYSLKSGLDTVDEYPVLRKMFREVVGDWKDN